MEVEVEVEHSILRSIVGSTIHVHHASIHINRLQPLTTYHLPLYLQTWYTIMVYQYSSSSPLRTIPTSDSLATPVTKGLPATIAEYHSLLSDILQ